MKINVRSFLGKFIYSTRWVLYPINIGLLIVLGMYVVAFLHNDYVFVMRQFTWDMESLMVLLLGFVDAAMVANLIIMIVQGGHQIFIHKFELPDKDERAQWLDHIDSGLLKVKTAQSIAGITLIQVLKDFVNIEKVEWSLIVHRMVIHAMALISAYMMAVIWRVTHPEPEHPPASPTPDFKQEHEHAH